MWRGFLLFIACAVDCHAKKTDDKKLGVSGYQKSAKINQNRKILLNNKSNKSNVQT
jgi:hypothetical protein